MVLGKYTPNTFVNIADYILVWGMVRLKKQQLEAPVNGRKESMSISVSESPAIVDVEVESVVSILYSAKD